MIPFNVPPKTGQELGYIEQAIQSGKLSGDGFFSKQCQQKLQNSFNCPLVLLTPSCTAALEMAAILINVQAGDEVIMPSYTFVSTANAFVLRGAKIVFVDIRPDTMNIDEKLIEAAITDKTRAIVPVHYAGVGCEMDIIMALAKQYNLFVIEDAAQGVMSTYKGKALGSIGHIGCYSFHETKNYTAGGEGGALLINDKQFITRAEIIREKGTNRSLFIQGQVDKYTWVDLGSSFLPSELQAAYLYAQLEEKELINDVRLAGWHCYFENLIVLENQKLISLPKVPEECSHNGHMFYIKLKNKEQRCLLISFLKKNNVLSVFHYIPLHSSPAGIEKSRFNGKDDFTTCESEKLLRLPLFFSLEEKTIKEICNKIHSFFKSGIDIVQ
ncbi:MAG: dTDP-4-amino-4,6-dideoxygalactose transaminase [Alteromonadaceae bacterium]|jgi:dTDP-4-amino-4,6-dideoxygalactose transaminase